MKKLFKSSPLPFVGQKRNFIKPYRDFIGRIPGNGEGWTIIDVFGGSGLLSHIAKHNKPAARVIYNDYDNYAERLRHIGDTNRLRALIYEALHNSEKKKALDNEEKAEVIKIINDFDGYKDLNCLSSWLLFSGRKVRNIEELMRSGFYHCVPSKNYPDAAGYLSGLEIVSEDFEYFKKFADEKNTVLVFDPPYVRTDQKTYKNSRYFGMVEFLKTMDMVREPYVFFSSDKSELTEYIEYLKAVKDSKYRIFAGAEHMKVSGRVSGNVAGYQDNMIMKFSAAS